MVENKTLSKNIYLTDEYVKNNPNLHIQDSVWKTEKIIPFIDKIDFNKKKEITILDVGGGAGEILKLISNYINTKYQIYSKKYMLDLSPKMLDIQKIYNPDFYKTFNEDICHTSINDKEIDITLMIDVLEHIPKPELALKELKRISSYVIFKVPLENNLASRFMNKISKGNYRLNIVKKVGHVNVFNTRDILKLIKKHHGKIIYYSYPNIYEHFNSSNYYMNQYKTQNIINRIYFLLRNRVLSLLFKYLPYPTCELFLDFLIILVYYKK